MAVGRRASSGPAVYTGVGFAARRLVRHVCGVRPTPGLRVFGCHRANDRRRALVRPIGVVWISATVATVIAIVYASRRPRSMPESDSRLRELLSAHHASNIEWMLTWGRIIVWFSDDECTAIGYKLIGSVALCLADPVGPLEQRKAALAAFGAHCFERGRVPCLFAAGKAGKEDVGLWT